VRMIKSAVLATLLMGASAGQIVLPAGAWAEDSKGATPDFGVGPQYGTTHVYMQPDQTGIFVESFLATFGGTSTKQAVATVTPVPSSSTTQLLLTPAGNLSVFGFKTPVPYPFGAERTGYLVTKLDAAVEAARAAGASVVVTPFDDPIGRDAVVQWPGGLTMQLYWHTKAPSYAPLQTKPENRVYVPVDKASAFIGGFIAFAHAKVLSDDPRAPGVEIGRPHDTFRLVRLESAFGNLAVFVTDGHLPYPYGREITGYEVADLASTLTKAKTAGAKVLVEPYTSGSRNAAIVQFPGGYIAEIHSPAGK